MRPRRRDHVLGDGELAPHRDRSGRGRVAAVIAVTGANGYVGGRILAHLRATGHEGALALVRRPAAGAEHERRYALAEPLANGSLEGVQTVVHAAWDASARGPDVAAVNVRGSLPLLDGVAARRGRVVFISSLSAHRAAGSDYGRAKLALEREVLERGGLALRPGLVFGVRAGGLFGALVGALAGRALAPVPAATERMFVTHDERLCELVARLATGELAPTRTLFAAHETPTSLGAIASEVGAGTGGRLRVVPLAPRPLYAALRAAEMAGLSLPFRSDSLRSLMSPIPLDEIASLERAGVRFPPLRRDLWCP
jgi:nucleoside-diphosphate-sugar epimerase